MLIILSPNAVKGQKGNSTYEQKDSIARLYNNIGVDYAVAGDFDKASLY